MSHPNAEAQKPSGGLMEDLINIFIKPSAVFEHQRNGSFAIPALIQTLLFAVLVFALGNLINPFFEAEVARGLAQAAKNGQAMPEGAQATAEKFGRYFALAFVIISPWFTALFGGIFGFIATRIVGLKLSFGQAALVASWASFPAVLGLLAMAIRGTMLDPSMIRGATDGQLGLGMFLDPGTASPALMALAQATDIFNLWAVILAGIGFSVLARVTLGKGLTAACIKFGIGLLLAVGMAVVRG